MQLFSAKCFRLPIYIPSFDAIHGDADMIFRRACKIFQTQLVLDGDKQMAVGLQQFSNAIQHAEGWIGICAEHTGVFKNADECYDVELLIKLEIIKAFSQYRNVIQISGSAGSNRGAARATL